MIMDFIFQVILTLLKEFIIYLCHKLYALSFNHGIFYIVFEGA
jgi:hypothetical protein